MSHMIEFRRLPESIESESLSIIRSEVGPHEFSPEEFHVVERMVQASADLDYADATEFRLGALQVGVEALQKGVPIVVDVEMVASGLRQDLLAMLGIQVRCAIRDEDILQRASDLGTTRAAVSIDKALSDTPHAVVAIGNAPTALIRVVELIREKSIQPPLVIGMPVGFVLASEAKEMLRELTIPTLVCSGRKGGSAVTVAAVNALLTLAVGKNELLGQG